MYSNKNQYIKLSLLNVTFCNEVLGNRSIADFLCSAFADTSVSNSNVAKLLSGELLKFSALDLHVPLGS